jgi:CTP synthase
MEKEEQTLDSNAQNEEQYSPLPKEYKQGQTKYVVITGSVISGVGKGTVSATLAKLLSDRGLNVEPMKLEAYLNVDAGTLSPFRHGEVFVLDDGTETDLDLGSYERMLEKKLTADHFVTSGRIYKQIIEKERAGAYLGRDVQFIPHVTGEIKFAVKNLATKTGADLVLIEVGGTAGDYENMFALEALRELKHEEGENSVCFINVTYILQPGALGEQKSKAAQLGIKTLMQQGIQPDIIVCRADSPVNESIREKIGLSANVPLRRVIGMHDVKNIYTLPLELREKRIDEEVLATLGLNMQYPLKNNNALQEWAKKAQVPKETETVTIGIAGKYVGSYDNYISILKALEHASFSIGKKIDVRWIDTTQLEEKKTTVEQEMRGVHGLIVPGGFGSRGVEEKIKCIEYCRNHDVPFLGICYGFQLALIEFARNVCHLSQAHTTEIHKNTPHPIVDLLPEQKTVQVAGASMRRGGHDVELKDGTKAQMLHNARNIRRRFRHRYECNPEYIELFEKNGIIFSGKAPNQDIMQILELPTHPFFMASQFHPEFTSRPLEPDPLFLEFAKKSAESSPNKEVF